MAEELSGSDRHKSHDMGLHAEQLAGRTQAVFFSPEEGDNYTYPEGFDVDFSKKTTLDVADMEPTAVNLRIRELMEEGYGHIVIQNPLAKHSLGVGILNRLKLDFEGSLGYFGCGLIDGPNIRITTFGAAIRGGDLVCKGDVGSRTGIDMKGGTIIVGGRAGAFTGFMMQRGRIIILGDAGDNLGDSLYDGTIYVGGKISSLGVDAVPGEITDIEAGWLRRKLALYGLEAPQGVENLTKIVAGKKLWNYDNLEPTEKKIAL
jgi:hypothetical protein